jgi:DNA helicase II / ATP-dependent DNA helicase PcrA
LNNNLDVLLGELNPRQKEAAKSGDGPLLIVAGAGSGKTRTLACRVSFLLSQGIAPQRIMLLTFTRRAAEEMLKRATYLAEVDSSLSRQIWGGTFHAIANRLLRIYSKSIGLNPGFTILDRSDSEDLINVIRNEISLSNKDKRFPRKGTCMSIYSRRVNGADSLEALLKKDFPWCLLWQKELNTLFGEYARRKQKQNLLDYDDLLLYWYQLLKEEALANEVGGRFDHILVDEYQDTNPIQSGILLGMRRKNKNITVVGDDAQSIYGFRSATVRNMLDFPVQFPGAKVVTLEQNYRSMPPILETTNLVIAQAHERYTKELWTDRKGGTKPELVTCVDESQQDEAVIKRVLEHYEQGIPLKQQAVLFRAASHSNSLELALGRHNIPFHKYGGLRFLETAHVKDLISILRIMENPRDEISWFRILQLLDGVGPSTAGSIIRHISENDFRPSSLSSYHAPASASEGISAMAALLTQLESLGNDVPSVQLDLISKFYIPLLERNYEDPEPRAADIEHLGQLAQRYSTRGEFLNELVLDPPVSTGDIAGPPLKDEDWLVLSTIHSAKGLEWDAVYLIHAADGNLPSDLATGDDEEIEEELRLTYVAMTRAKNFLYVLWPLRYYHKTSPLTDNHNYAQLCRFFTGQITATMECLVPPGEDRPAELPPPDMVRGKIIDRINEMWN